MFNQKLGVTKIIFCNMDSVLGSLFTSILFKPKYGQIDIIHELRAANDPRSELSDVAMLRMCKRDVISTCWDMERTAKAVAEGGFTGYRVYILGKQV